MIKINPTKEAIDFHYIEVESILNDIVNLKKGYETISNSRQSKLTLKQLNFIKKNIPKIINSHPKELLILHQDFEKISPYNNIKTKTLFEYLYTNYFPNKDFLEKLGIDTCTYCNKNYTIQFSKDRARAELDHWFPKSEFPILALSFYNLIPSCHSCNHLKLNKSPKNGGWKKALENLNHPYECENEFSFSYNYKTYNDFQMKIMVEKESKSAKTLEFNKTEEIYNAHSDRELKDLLDLRYKYSKNYLDILLNNTFPNLSMSKEEAYRMIFGIEINEKDFHKRPFSKFKKDIIEELLKIK
jgi:hypothetical protein